MPSYMAICLGSILINMPGCGLASQLAKLNNLNEPRGLTLVEISYALPEITGRKSEIKH